MTRNALTLLLFYNVLLLSVHSIPSTQRTVSQDFCHILCKPYMYISSTVCQTAEEEVDTIKFLGRMSIFPKLAHFYSNGFTDLSRPMSADFFSTFRRLNMNYSVYKIRNSCLKLEKLYFLHKNCTCQQNKRTVSSTP